MRFHKFAKKWLFVSSCLSVRKEQLGSQLEGDFQEILHLTIFRKTVNKIQTWLISNKNAA